MPTAREIRQRHRDQIKLKNDKISSLESDLKSSKSELSAARIAIAAAAHGGGGGGGGGGGASGDDDPDKGLCIVCLERPKSWATNPCRHVCLCETCKDWFLGEHANGILLCPMCRVTLDVALPFFKIHY